MKQTKKAVLILSTGGTICMQKTQQGYAPAPGYLEKSMAKIPELHNADMPHYVIHEFEKPIDSANMTPSNWHQIAEHIKHHYHEYDGFVVLHGTDTMAYTASALSFMLENLSKPVILTGSQLPLFETRNDARENLINALWIAGNYNIPEVCVYFGTKLFRGNRVSKIDASSFAAFDSPNFPIIGKVGTDIRIRHELLLEIPSAEFQLQKINPLAVSVLRIFPGMSIDIIRPILQLPLKAVILQTYGIGTAPEEKSFLDLIQQTVERGIVIVNCSQCAYAKVRMSDYVSGSALLSAGVISGADMTIEAALTKLFYLFSKELALEAVKNQLKQSLRGELTL